ncbi:MAG TPA: hypothetical protein VM941_01415 [Pyrinomonadaceae bacterium]|nr:hypothetical protein [Pyrinomonadaceae bacterium]
MRNDDLDRNMGGAGQNKENYGGQQTPGRNKQDQDDDMKTGQRGAGQQGQHGKQGQNPAHIEDDFGTSGNKGADQGGQNRGNF